jgi:hypothetical protein
MAKANEQLTVFESEFAVENWRVEGQAILADFMGAHGSSEEAEQVKNSTKWRMADWLLYGQENLKDDKAVETEAKKVVRLSRRTVWDYIRTAKAFPESRRRDSLSWSHHKEIATSNFDAAAQDKLLDQAQTNSFSVIRLRTAARKEVLAAKKEANKGKIEKIDPTTGHVHRKSDIKVKFTLLHKVFLRDFCTAIRSASDQGTSYRWHPDEVVHTIVCEWIKDNLDFMLAAITKRDKRWDEPPPNATKVLAEPPGFNSWLEEISDSPWYKLSRSAERVADIEGARAAKEFDRRTNKTLPMNVQECYFRLPENSREGIFNTHWDRALDENKRRDAENARLLALEPHDDSAESENFVNNAEPPTS